MKRGTALMDSVNESMNEKLSGNLVKTKEKLTGIL
jgi:hypothetical protein